MTDIWKTQQGCGLELGQEEVKGRLLIQAPRPRLILTSQGGKGGGRIGELRDEPAVEVTKT